jgi:hypothetical protein
MGLSARDALQHYGRELATGPIAEGVHINRSKKGRPRSRVSMNLMLSMPAGTDTGAFEPAVRDFLNEQFQAPTTGSSPSTTTATTTTPMSSSGSRARTGAG